MAFEIGKLINNWTKDLTIFTNGTSTLTGEQSEKLTKHTIKINETEIDNFNHINGHIESIVFKNGEVELIKALYARPEFEQHCNIPQQLTCEITDQHYIKIDAFQKTSTYGIFACGDNTTMMRSVSYAIATGGIAGAMTNRELIDEQF